MITFDKTDLQRFAISAVGALVLASASIGAAVAPVHAATPASVTVADWQHKVESRLNLANDPVTLTMAPGTMKDAVLKLRFTPDGDFAGAAIARSSGDNKIDAHALKVADRFVYPRLPAALRGKPQTVAMRLVFGNASDAAQYADMLSRIAPSPKPVEPAQMAAR